MSSAELTCGEVVTDKKMLAVLQRECLQLAHMSSAETSFPGSQPVSFERKHLEKALNGIPYFAAEKTDGVRYMLLASQHGAFLVDRRFTFRRIRLHLPRRDIPQAQVAGTLLDGELVEDHDPGSGAKTLRYLVYDAVAVHSKLLLGETLPMRLLYTHKFVLAPRALDRAHDYSSEPFTVELKGFFDVGQLRYVFEQVIPTLQHENDGIIFTPVAEPYVTGTCHSLLKWKPSHMNTVDFRLLTIYRQREPRYQLGAASGTVTVFFGWLDPVAEDLSQLDRLDGQIIECFYDPEWTTTEYADGKDWSMGRRTRGGWRYMRPREDKHIPNDQSVVKKVMKSIEDNVTQDELLASIEGADEGAPASALALAYGIGTPAPSPLPPGSPPGPPPPPAVEEGAALAEDFAGNSAEGTMGAVGGSVSRAGAPA
eukprot:CAMPEP_0179871048 /NCGR_PEP_ID=MMETSP0982-20121206/20632_1 /TAXON_ID=483367 /ORGANISM="non described non described, Strain CCMP 2436" /LENGTH=424 /DNA_ID=CAMNT_0021761721 /DNA_START=24 /DNA_END=1295 /DNA_ORIENTATION=+